MWRPMPVFSNKGCFDVPVGAAREGWSPDDQETHDFQRANLWPRRGKKEAGLRMIVLVRYVRIRRFNEI